MKNLLFAILILPILGCTELSVENDNLSEGIELSIEHENISEKIESEIRLLLEDVNLISLSKRLIETQDSLTSEVINSVLTEKEKTAFINFNLFITTSHEDIFKVKYNSEFYLLFDDYSSVIFDDLLLKCNNSNKSGGSQIFDKNACNAECASFILASAGAVASCAGSGFTLCGLSIASFVLAVEALDECLAENDQETCW